MRFDYMLIGFLIFSLFVLGGVAMINDLDDSYEDTVNMTDEDFGEVYNTIDEMYDTTSSAKEKTLEGDISDSESWESMTKGSYSAVRLVTGSFKLFTDITNAIALKLSIPQFIIKIAFIIFTISIIFGIVYMIFRFIPR